METCDVCGNDYDKMLEVSYDGSTRTFDCFECAIEGLAPRCTQCGTTIVGHGVEAGEEIYCCAHCAREDGIEQLVDRA